MRALLWKELRENFKWALLAMVGLTLAECYALYQSANGMAQYYSYSNGNEGITLCKTSFLTVTTFGCAGAGLLLGLIQILPELNRDRWAALLHRPVSRGSILRGKVVAGLLLYVLATVPPFLFSVWLVATPGHFGAPFVPGMVFPGTADICTGAVWYFAALALALQRGGWIGLRLFPLFAAFHTASFVVVTTNLFYVAVEATVLMSLALFTAAWGTIQNQERLSPRPWLGRFAFLAVAFYGACGAGDLALLFISVVGPTVHSHSEQIELSDDGVPLHLIYRDQVVVAVTDLNGNTPTDKKYQLNQVRSHLNYMNGFSSYIGDSHGWTPSKWPTSYRETRSYIYWAYNPYQYPRLEQWFALTNPQYLIGYLPAKKQEMSLLDFDGFKPVTAKPNPIPPEAELGELSDEVLIFQDKASARLINMPTRQITNLVLPAPGPIYGHGTAYSRGGGNMSVVGLALGTGLALYDQKGNPIALLPYHQDMDRWGELEMGINDKADRFYLWYKPSAWIDGKTRATMPSYVEEMDTKGQVFHAYTLPPVPPYSGERSWKDFLTQRIQSPAYFFGLMAYRKIGATFGSTRMAGDLNWQFVHDRRYTQIITHYILVISLLLAGLTLFWARRVYFSWSRAWAWTAFVFAFNLPGFITFRVASGWPQLVPCPACGKPRPTEYEQCPHCRAGWPAPPREATEIFEPAPEPALSATPA